MKIFGYGRLCVLRIAFVFCMLWGMQGALYAEKVMILASNESGSQWIDNVMMSLSYMLHNTRDGKSIESRIFKVDFDAAGAGSSHLDLIAKELKNEHYDLIVTSDMTITRALVEHIDELELETPIVTARVFENEMGVAEKYPNMTGLICSPRSVETIALAAKLFPKHSTIVILMGKDESRTVEKELVRTLSAMPETAGKNIVVYNDAFMTTEDMLKSLSQISKDKIIVPLLWRDSRFGNAIRIGELVLRLNDMKAGPVFSVFDDGMRYGLCGGIMVTSDECARQLYDMCLRVIEQQSADSVPFKHEDSKPFFNYEQLRNLGANASALPRGAEFLDEPSVMRQEYMAILVFMALFLLIAIMVIIYLVGVNRKNKLISAVFKNLPLRIFVTDKSGKVLFIRTENSMNPFKGSDSKRIKSVEDLPEAVQKAYEDIEWRIFISKEPNIVFEYYYMGQNRRVDASYLPKEVFGREALLWVSSDVTELARAVEAHKEMAERMTATVESIGDGVIATDTYGRITMCNKTALGLMGCGYEDAIYNELGEVFKLLDFSSGAPAELPIWKAISENRVITLDARCEMVSKNGARLRISATAAPISDSKGRISGAVMAFRDVTREYVEMDKLESSNFLMHSASEIAKIGYFRLDENGNRISAQIPASILPYDSGADLHCSDWMDPVDHEAFDARWQKLLSGEISEIDMRCRSRMTDHRRFYNLRLTRVSLTASEDVNFMGVLQDISDIVENEMKYLDNSTMLNSILDNLPCSVSVKDFTGGDRYLIANRLHKDIFGLTDFDVVGKTDNDLFPPDIAQKRAAADALLKRSEGVVESQERVSLGGTPRDLQVSRAKFMLPTGRELILGIHVDITENKNLQRELQIKNRTLSYILDNMPACVSCKDPDNDFRYVMWNRMMEEMTGIDAAEALGKTDFELKPFPGLEGKARVEDMEAVHSNEAVEVTERVKNAGGREFVLRTVKTLIKLDGGRKLLFSLSDDITQEHAADEERTRMLAQLDAYARQERVVNTCFSSLVANNDFDSTMAEVLGKLGQSVEADYCCVYYFNEDFSAVHLEHGWQSADVRVRLEDLKTITIPPGTSWLESMRRLEITMLSDIWANYKFSDQTGEVFKRIGLKSMASAGISRDAKLWGFVAIGYIDRKRSFTNFDESFMRSFASSIEIAIIRRDYVEKLLHSEYEKTLILDNIEIPILLFDKSGVIVRVNKAAAKYFNHSEEDLRHSLCDIANCSFRDDKANCPVKRVVTTGKPYTQEIELANGNTFVSMVTPIYSPKGELLNILECIIDTTSQTQAKKQIILAREAAESSNRAKSAFLATMSHEIRTPLNAIIGLSELLMSHEMPTDLSENISSINIAGRSLLSIINDVLEFSKIEADKLEIFLDWVQPDEVFDEIRRVFETQARQKNVVFNVQIDPEVPEIYFSRINLRQMLFNLVGNAIKFTERGRIDVTFDKLTGDAKFMDFQIRIKDTGMGIDNEDLQRIFNPFEQADIKRRNPATQGTGLGLAIVSRLVAKLGGTISLNSALGKGSEFILTFKRVAWRPRTNKKAILIEEKPLDIRGVKIWVIDDVELNCKVLSKMLLNLGAQSEYMTVAKAALRRLDNGELPDLILTDMWMPEMNGTEFALAVRKTMGGKRIPIVAVTADTEARQNFSLGEFEGVLLKPITTDRLRKLLASLHLKG